MEPARKDRQHPPADPISVPRPPIPCSTPEVAAAVMTRLLAAALLLLLAIQPAWAGMGVNTSSLVNYGQAGRIQEIAGASKLTTCFSTSVQSIVLGDTILRTAPTAANSTGMLVGNRTNATEIAFYLGIAGNTFAIASKANTVKTTGEWQRFCWVYDGTQAVNAMRAKLYLDGVDQGPLTLVNTMPTTIANPFGTSNLCVASNGLCTSATGWHGVISDVKMWIEAFNSDQVAREFHSWLPLQTAALVFWAPMDDCPGFSNYAEVSRRADATTSVTCEPSDPRQARP